MRQGDVEARFAAPSTPPLGHAISYARIQEGCLLLAHGINNELPDGREKSQALTQLELVLFWALAAVCRQPAPDS